jgi:hypothetical protein
MKRILIFFILMISSLMVNFVYAEQPKSEKCPVSIEVKHKLPRLKFTDPKGQLYRSSIHDAAQGPIDFAGHYIMATWGCGAGCVMGAVIDAKSGHVTSLPFTVSDWPLDVIEPLSYRADSCILAVRGKLNERGKTGPHFYKFDGRSFSEIPKTDNDP